MGELLLESCHGPGLLIAAVCGLAVAHKCARRLPPGLPRLLVVLPTLPIFFMLPLTVHVYHLRAILSFIFLWTVPSKLLLLCWDADIDYKLSDGRASFLYFATTVMLPIRVKGKSLPKEAELHAISPFCWQFIAVIAILNAYSYRNGFPLWLIYILYSFHIYLGLELMLGGLAKAANAFFGVESDPQFNNPFMAASLTEFWGKRWNLVVTTILRSTVYNPALSLLAKAELRHKQHQHSQTAAAAQSKRLRSSCTTILHPPAVAESFMSGKHQLISSSDDAYGAGGDLIPDKTASDPRHRDDLISCSESCTTTDGCTITSCTTGGCPITSCSTTCDANPAPHEETLQQLRDHGLRTTTVACSSSRLCCSSPTNGHNYVTCSEGNGCTLSTDDVGAFSPDPTLVHTNEYCNGGDNAGASGNKVISAGDHEGTAVENMTAAADRFVSDGCRTEGTITEGGSTACACICGDGAPAADERVVVEEKPSMQARAVAMLATFVVSGLIHELIFYYINMGRSASGEVTAFFVVQGVATAVEVVVRRSVGDAVRLPRFLSIALTMAFLYLTVAWLFMPPLTRTGADVHTIAEYQRFQSALLALFHHHRPPSPL